MAGLRDPLNFWGLNANSSKTVKATDFKFDVHVSRYSPDMTPYFFGKGGICKNSLGGDKHCHERLLVFTCTRETSRKLKRSNVQKTEITDLRIGFRIRFRIMVRIKVGVCLKSAIWTFGFQPFAVDPMYTVCKQLKYA